MTSIYFEYFKRVPKKLELLYNYFTHNNFSLLMLYCKRHFFVFAWFLLYRTNFLAALTHVQLIYPYTKSTLGPAIVRLVKHSAHRGSSRWRNGATGHIIDMFWQYRSPIPVRRKGGLLLAHDDYYLDSRRTEGGKGKGDSPLCSGLRILFRAVLS
jgi:hypothetical protein